MPRGCSALVALCLATAPLAAAALELRKGDHLALVGGGFAERIQHDGWFETLVHLRFPDHELVFRNLAFNGDELTVRHRSSGFGSADEWLRRSQADVVLAFFGFNESFAGEEGLGKFRKDLEAWIERTLGQRYAPQGRDGGARTPPRLVLFSPAAFEHRRDPLLGDGVEANRRLAAYGRALEEAARARGLVFVDLFQLSGELYRQAERPLTLNGIHPNEEGSRRLALALDGALFGAAKGSPPPGGPSLEALRRAVLDKGFHWFHRYRVTDGYSTYGGRSELRFVDGQTNFQVLQRELEVLDVMTSNRDRAIWAVAREAARAGAGGAAPPLPYIDDSNTPPFLPVKTNKPGPGPAGEHVFLGGEEAIGKMQAARGLRVELVASEERFPELANPVQMAFDPRGRLFVAAWPSYPHWKPKTEMNDKLLILEDADGDGRADACKTFADRLHNPTGFEFWGGGVLLAMAPDLLFLKDVDGDDRADVRQWILGGIDSADTHHTANSFVLDPAGALYFQEGVFHRTQVETPYGPMRNNDACVWRFEPRTWRLERYIAFDFANPHGHVFDRWGRDMVFDGTSAEGYDGALFSGHLDFPRKHSRPPRLYAQRERPCPAVEILQSGHFPEESRGNLLVANVIGFQGILQYRMKEQGSSLAGEEAEPFLFSSDPNFRPSDLEVGPDGALYFTDWHNPIIGHMQHNLRDPSRDQTHGRVYRVVCQGRPLLKAPPVAGQPLERLLDLLKEPEDRLRYRARIELSARDGAQVAAAVKKWADTLDARDPDREHHLLEALWVAAHHHAVDEALLRRLLRSAEPRARAAATRVLCLWRDRLADPLALLRVQAEDEHPRVRLEAVRAASFFRGPRAAETALLAMKHPLDEGLRFTLGETLRQLEPWKKALAESAEFASENPVAVEYLLQNYSLPDMLRLPRTPVVCRALLSRPGVLSQDRQAALEALARQGGGDSTEELLKAIERTDRSEAAHAEAVLGDLGHVLLGAGAGEKQAGAEGHHTHAHAHAPEARGALREARASLASLARDGRRALTRRIALAALATADGSVEPAWRDGQRSAQALLDVLEAVPLIPDPALRGEAHVRIRPLLDGLPPGIGDGGGALRGRYVRIELPRRGTLTLAEVEVFSGGTNIAPRGKARQSSVGHGGEASRAIDGNRSGRYGDGGQTHTREDQQQPWWELDLGTERPLEAVVVWNRSEAEGQYAGRLEGFTLSVLDAARQGVFRAAGNRAPAEKVRLELAGDPAAEVRRAALEALVTTGRDEEATFSALARLAREGLQPRPPAGAERGGRGLTWTALRALGRLPRARWPRAEVPPLLDSVLAHVRSLPAEERASGEVRGALQVAEELATVLPAASLTAARRAVRELGVPTITIRPVPHLMLYDRIAIHVEAGKPVEIVFENTDLMPHNLLVVRPGAADKVGLEAEKMAADLAGFTKGFVPALPEVLHATRLLQPQESERLAFTAPSEPGDYPYVCTFPGHWRRMRGVLHVVRNLEEVPPEELARAAAGPTAPGAGRPFVRAWTVEDLRPHLDRLADDRDLGRGKQLTDALGCLQCHRLNGAGGEVGPDLAGVKVKALSGKMSPLELLTELVEPSKVIEEKYRTVVFTLKDGQIVPGIVLSEEQGRLRIATNPLDRKQEPLSVPLEAVNERLPALISMMPEGLLSSCLEEEVLDLLAYLLAGGG